MNDMPNDDRGLSTEMQRARWASGVKYVPCRHSKDSLMKPLLIGCSILFAGFLLLWVACSLAMQCQGFQ